MNIAATKDGMVIEVYVKPNSKKFKFELDNGELVIFSSQEPSQGKVNKEIIKETSRFFESQVEILTGLTSKQKRILIKNVEKTDIENKIDSLLNNKRR